MSNDQHDNKPAGEPRTPIDPTGTSTPPPPPPGYVPAVYVQGPGGKGANKIVAYLLMVGLLVSVTLNVYLYGPVNTIAKALAGGVQEVHYSGPEKSAKHEDRIVIVEIAGTINGEVAEFARQAFNRLEQDPPAAVVLRVESGGGGVTASDQIWHAVTAFQQTHPDIPVVASFGIAAASGGYYISAPTDYIFAERTTVTGSIGVLAQVPQMGGMIEMLGIEMNMVIADKSGQKADANNRFVEWYDEEGNLTEEGEASIKVVKNLLNNSYDTFLNVVVDGRTNAKSKSKITKAEMQAVATGEIFIGKEALQAKLVDEIGYLDDAIAYAATQAGQTGEPTATIIRKVEPGMLGSLVEHDGVNLSDVTADELRGLVDDATAVRLEYRMRLR